MSIEAVIQQIEAEQAELCARYDQLDQALKALRSIAQPAAEPAAEPEPEPEPPAKPVDPVKEAIAALRQSWADAGHIRQSKNGATPASNYLPRGLEPPAGHQLVRTWVEHTQAKFLTARSGAKATGLTPSAVIHRLRRLEAEGLIVYHGRVGKGSHPREMMFGRIGGPL